MKRWFWDYISIEIMFYTSMAQGKGNLQQKIKWMNFGTVGQPVVERLHE